MPEPSDRRHQLSAFLRSRRERLTPEDVGLPRTGRRRTPGLRREELALLAGISATWYTYLEQGREIRVSEQVLNALAAALRLDRHEREHLLRLAGHLPAAEAGTRQPLAAELAAVPRALQPNPAYIIDGTYDVLSHNEAADELFPGLFPGLITGTARPTEQPTPRPTAQPTAQPTEQPAPRPANLVRWTFLEPVAREVLIDWEPEARGLLARLRTMAARHPADRRYTRLIDELNERSPEARAWWPRYEVQARRGGRKRLRHPERGVVEYAYTAFHLAEQPEQTLVIYLGPTEPGDR